MNGPNLSFLKRPGFREGLMSAGMAMMAQSDTPGSTVLGNLGRALPVGMQAGKEAAERQEYDAMMESAPPQMRQLLKMLGPERGAAFMLQQAMAGPPDPVAVGVNERLANPVTGEIVLDAVQQPGDRDVRTIGDTLVEVPGVGAPQVIYDAPDAGPDATEVGALRDDFERNIMPYEGMAQAFRKMEASATGEATPAKDIALIFNYMKAVDPSSSVREGEYATAQNAGSAFDIVGNLYNRLLTGQRLNETQRAEFLNSAREQIASQLTQYQAVADQYRGIAESNRYDPAQVIRNPFTGLNLAPTVPTATTLSDDEIMRRILGR